MLGEPGDVAHRRKFTRAAMVDPVPQLRGAHVELALGRADFGQRKFDLGARPACKAHGRAILGFQGGGGHDQVSSRRAATSPPNTSLVCAETRTKVVRFGTSLRWAAPM